MSKEDLVKHKWAGFEVEINFSQITQKAEPLPDGTYQVYIQVNTIDQDSTYKETVLSLGNISGLLNNGFHSTKMEYFSAKKLLVYNLMASYNRKEKTLEIVSTKLKDINPAELEYQNVKTKQYKFMRKYVFKLLYMIFCLFPIKGNRVLFATDSRTELNGNFGFIHDEMISRNLNIDYRYMLKESIDEKKTFKDIWNLAFWCATSKKIILDDFYPMIYPLRIRKEADLIQVWHAVGAFKTFGYSRVGRPGGPSIRSINHRTIRKLL
ncbi:polyribitolphosphotransferase [Bacillus sp. JCM 19047]|nr:polyribitolphosphotransferase [Bacillus sp. JCM 19047]